MKEVLFLAVMAGLFFIFMKLFVLTPPQENIIKVGHCYKDKNSTRIVVTEKLEFGYKYRIVSINSVDYRVYGEVSLTEMDCY